MVKVTLHGKEWERSVQITGGEINIHADLGDEKDSSTPVDTKTAKQAASPWGASQPAVDELRSLAEKLKQCPEIWLKYPAYQWGKKSTEIEQERTTQPRNVIWDVTSSESSRSPYSGYLQYSVHPEIDVLPVESYGEWLKKRGLIWDMAQKIMSIDLKFEFDVGPSGLELVRVLSRSKAYPDWETSPSTGWPGCTGVETKKPQSGIEAQPKLAQANTQPWNRTAIQAEFVELAPSNEEGRVNLWFTLTNTTGADYKIERVNEVMTAGWTIDDELYAFNQGVSFDVPLIVPAHQKTKELLHVNFPKEHLRVPDDASYADVAAYRAKVMAFLRSEYAGWRGVVIRDERTGYRIDFPLLNAGGEKAAASNKP